MHLQYIICMNWSEILFLTEGYKDIDLDLLKVSREDLALAIKSFPNKKQFISPQWHKIWYVSHWNEESDDKILYFHGAIWNAHIFDFQMTDDQFSDYHHIWIDFISSNLENNVLLKELSFEEKELHLVESVMQELNLLDTWFHIVAGSYWVNVASMLAAKYPDAVKGNLWWWPAFMTNEKTTDESVSWMKFVRQLIWNTLKQKNFFDSQFWTNDTLPKHLYLRWFYQYANETRKFLHLVAHVKNTGKIIFNASKREEFIKRLHLMNKNNVPATVILGWNDVITPVVWQQAKRERELWSSLQDVKVYDRSGHAPYIDNSKQFNEDMRTLLLGR